MRLDLLCNLELSYRALPSFDQYIVFVKPFGTEEGSAYGEGDGKVSGPRLSGSVRWVNHPHRRSDGVMLPDAHGLILTEDGATLLFSLQGRTAFVSDQGQQLMHMLFETEAEQYQWLNTALCVVEGTINQGRIQARVYVCVYEN
jgi:hypothetical protein